MDFYLFWVVRGIMVCMIVQHNYFDEFFYLKKNIQLSWEVGFFYFLKKIIVFKIYFFFPPIFSNKGLQ